MAINNWHDLLIFWCPEHFLEKCLSQSSPKSPSNMFVNLQLNPTFFKSSTGSDVISLKRPPDINVWTSGIKIWSDVMCFDHKILWDFVAVVVKFSIALTMDAFIRVGLLARSYISYLPKLI